MTITRLPAGLDPGLEAISRQFRVRLPITLPTLVGFLLLSLAPALSQNTTPHLLMTVHGELPGDYFSTVACAGDLNSDGYDDLLASGWAHRGYVRVYLGGPSPDTTAAMEFGNFGGEFGYALAGGIDFNGDGYPDFAVGAPYYTVWNGPEQIPEAGAVFVYYGGPALDTIPDWVVKGQNWYGCLGTSLAFAQDINGDGYGDLLVGAANGSIMSGQGCLYLFYGGPHPDTVAAQLFEGKHGYDFFANSIASIGDLNGDGLSDLIVGNPETLTRNAYGRAYLMYGSAHMSFDTTLVLRTDTIPGTFFGHQVAALGDINGDGFPDFGVLGRLQSWIYLGAPTIQAMQVLTSTTDSLSGDFSFITGGASITGDGKPDVVVSTQLVQGHYWGNVQCFAGMAPFTLTPAFHLEGPYEDNGFGCSIALLPKFTGRPCLAVGDDQFSGSRGPGRVFIYELASGDAVQATVDSSLPRHLLLQQNYPNPFNPSTRVPYHLARGGPVEYRVFNLLGECVKHEGFGVQSSGDHHFVFRASGLATGAYVLRLSAGEETAHIMMVLVK